MKALALTLIGTTVLAGSAFAQMPDMVFVAPGLGQQRCIAQLQPVIDSFAKSAARGRSLPFYDATTNRQIAALTVPDNELYESPSPRRTLRKNGAAIGAFREFCSRPQMEEPSMLFYDALRFAGNNRRETKATDIVLIGPPRAIDLKSTRTSMHGGLVPGDGHYTVSRGLSPFGTQGEETLLQNVRVHFATVDDSWAVTPAHKTEAGRAAALSVTMRGGEFASFESDIGTVLTRIQNAAVNKITFRPLSRTDRKLVMVDFGAPLVLYPNIFERPLSAVPLAKTELNKAQENVSIGIAWDCACDADLVVTAAPASPPLYWDNRRTADGRFLKDYRTANAKRGYEMVVLNRPVDLGDLMIAVNFYAGDAPEGLGGKVRIALGDKTYEAPFEIEATRGNSGKGLQQIVERNGEPGIHWTVLDAVKIAGAAQLSKAQ